MAMNTTYARIFQITPVKSFYFKLFNTVRNIKRINILRLVSDRCYRGIIMFFDSADCQTEFLELMENVQPKSKV